jgi:predicted metal-dependent phosphotriesterase family hydrolase
MTDSFSRRQWLGLFGVGSAAAMLPRLASGAKAPDFPKRAIIRTLAKDIPPSEMGTGVTLFHEHLSLDISRLIGPRPANARPLPAPIGVDVMIEEVKAAQRDGVTCIVDGGHNDMGRDLEALKQITERTGMHIVASGGYYMERNYPADIASKTEEQIADDLVREASVNRFGAFGEIGENPNAVMSDLERKMFRAVGRAHLRTNLPVFTHNAYGTGPNVPKEAGLQQLDALESVGMKPQRAVIGHTCCLDDPEAEVIKAIAKRGAWVGFDRVNTLEQMVSDENRVKMLLKFLDAGYANQLLLSSDFTGGRTVEGPLYGRTKTVFAPKLVQAGVREETVHAILYDNPRRFLAFVPKKA